MVQGTLAHSHAQVAVAVTGVAALTGGSPAKPVGTVWFGRSLPGRNLTEQCCFTGHLAAGRVATVQHPLARNSAIIFKHRIRLQKMIKINPFYIKVIAFHHFLPLRAYLKPSIG